MKLVFGYLHGVKRRRSDCLIIIILIFVLRSNISYFYMKQRFYEVEISLTQSVSDANKIDHRIVIV